MRISKAEYKVRIQNLQRNMRSSKLDAFIVSEEEDIYYFTGLTYKSLERLFLLIIKKDSVSFILPKMELAHLSKVDHVDQILSYWEYPAPKAERWQDVLLNGLQFSELIGISPKSPFEIADFLRQQDVNVKLNNGIEELRWIKSHNEIELIKQASKYCDIAIDRLNASAYYGMSELEVFTIGKDIQKKVIIETDFDYLSSNILVAAWPSRISHEPHGVPKVSDLLVEGSHISLAFLRVNGYAAELERTFFTSPPTNEQQDIFEIMMEARRRSYSVLRAGVPAEEVDIASRAYIEEQGLGDKLMHRTGHGIGLGNHEGPYLAIGDQTILKENMVVSIEPGIYIEGVGGYRHSDTVRITKDGYEMLTHCNDKLKDLIFKSGTLRTRLKGRIIKRMFNI